MLREYWRRFMRTVRGRRPPPALARNVRIAANHQAVVLTFDHGTGRHAVPFDPATAIRLGRALRVQSRRSQRMAARQRRSRVRLVDA